MRHSSGTLGLVLMQLLAHYAFKISAEFSDRHPLRIIIQDICWHSKQDQRSFLLHLNRQKATQIRSIVKSRAVKIPISSIGPAYPHAPIFGPKDRASFS